jgi:DNA polymerase-3 subunit delta
MPSLSKTIPCDEDKENSMIYTVSGDNAFERNRLLKERVARFVEAYGDFALERIRGDEATADQLRAILTSMPFLAERKLVVVYQSGANKEFVETAKEIFADVPDSTDVLLDEPKLDKRTAYYKWLKAHTTFEDCAPLDERRLLAWMVSYTKQHGSALSQSDAAYLLQRVGAEQQRLANELDKLSLFAGTITRERIDDLTVPTPQSKIFDMLDAAFSGDIERALELYDDQRAQRVEPQEIIGMLGWQLRQIALVKTAGNRDVVREAKMSPYAASKAKRIADRMTLARLKQLVDELTRLDVQSKRSALDLDLALKAYISHIA